MHKPESILENETHKPHWDFERKIIHLIPVKKKVLAVKWILLFPRTAEWK